MSTRITSGWRYPAGPSGIGPILEAPVIGWGLVYVVTDRGRVQAIDQYQGSAVWSGEVEGPPAGPALVVAESLVVCSRAGRVYLFDARDGGGMAVHETGMELTSSPAWWSGRLVLAGIADQEPTIVAMALTGETAGTAWVHRGGSPALARVLASPSADDGVVAVADTAGSLRLLDAGSGVLHWQVQIEGGGPVYGPPTLANASVYVATRNGACARIETRSGKPKGWRSTRVSPPVHSSIAVSGDTAYLTSSAGIIYEFDATTGGKRGGFDDKRSDKLGGTKVARCPGWNTRLTSAVITSDYVFFGAPAVYVHERAGSVYGFHRRSKWADLVTVVDSPVVAPPAVSDGVLCVATAGGFVYGLREWRADDE